MDSIAIQKQVNASLSVIHDFLKSNEDYKEGDKKDELWNALQDIIEAYRIGAIHYCTVRILLDEIVESGRFDEAPDVIRGLKDAAVYRGGSKALWATFIVGSLVGLSTFFCSAIASDSLQRSLGQSLFMGFAGGLTVALPSKRLIKTDHELFEEHQYYSILPEARSGENGCRF